MNPLVLILFGIFSFLIYAISRYGGLQTRVPLLIVSGLLLIGWFSWRFYRKQSLPKDKTQTNHPNPLKVKINRWWIFFASLFLIGTSALTAFKVYESAQPYNGKLAWYVQRWKNEREVSFTRRNIYEHHLDGIFEAIDRKIPLPDDLYVSNDFSLHFEKNGRITSFDTLLYGFSPNGELKSFSISYNEKQSDKIQLYLDNEVEASFDEKKEFQPLIRMVQELSLKEKLSATNQDTFELYYEGVRSIGYGADQNYYLTEDNELLNADLQIQQPQGYALLLYGDRYQEDTAPLLHLVYDAGKTFSDDAYAKAEEPTDWELGYNYNEGEETFFLDEDLGYQLSIIDAASGKRFYELLQTTDGGDHWELHNPDPFIGEMGGAAGITFIDESLGFLALSRFSGTEAYLYRTADGGISYERIEFPTFEVHLGENKSYEPYVFPKMPYEEEGKLFMPVGQGQDGDHKGGIDALYQSEDRGKTWIFVREME